MQDILLQVALLLQVVLTFNGKTTVSVRKTVRGKNNINALSFIY
jgi:hypothetical protein